MSEHVRLPVAMTVEEFMDWEPGDGRSWQLIDGQPHAITPNYPTQGAIMAEVCGLVANHLRDRGDPGIPVMRPGIIPTNGARHNFRIPAMAVTLTQASEDDATLTDPVLLIEILSPSNQTETWSNVWAYTSIPSVMEILVVRSLRVGAELLTRRPDGSWPPEPQRLVDGELVLHSIGLRVPLAALYRTTRLAGTMPPG